jgi:epoxyqueuosine reductase QueG
MVGPEINRVGHKVALFLEDHDNEAVMVRAYYGAPIDWEKQGMIGDFPMRRAAVEAGLGQIGDNKLLITERFGPRVWLLPVITTAQLEPDGRYKDEICDHCGLCVDACPTGFLRKKDGSLEDFLKESSKCMYHNEPGALAGLLRFLENKIIGKNKEEQLRAIKTPEFWNFWYFLLYGGLSYECGKCMRICPK